MIKNQHFQTKTNKFMFIVFLLFSVAIAVLIFCFSSENATASDSTSGNTIKFLLQTFYPGYKNLAAIRKKELVGSFQFIVRKSAHFSIYTALGFFTCGAMLNLNGIKKRDFFRCHFAVVICVVYCISDEIHQSFVPGRACQLRDMLIDTAGILSGTVIMFALYIIVQKTVKMKKRIKTAKTVLKK